MKTSHKTSIIVLGAIVLTAVLLGIVQVRSTSASRDNSYRSAFYDILASAEDRQSRHFVIYLNVDACLACIEDMSAWKELEDRLPECGCSFSFWAPASDSLDVAYAMELEGLNTPVRVLSTEELRRLEWLHIRTPVKVLLDNLCQPIETIGLVGNPDQARYRIEQLISKVCSER